MEGKLQKYIVKEQPPWYFTSENKNVFSCESTRGLFDRVVKLMIGKQEELSRGQNAYKPKTVYKLIRTMVIEDADTIQQKPSRSLLLALMDLVDMEGGNDFMSVASVDKAGVKHLLLAYHNYTSFYIPQKELICTTGKKVIPVVTQYSDKRHFFHCDELRSMVGTYLVSLPTTGTGQEACYFVQEVLFVPGLKSLDLLKVVTENKFAFWDVSLEVPTHSTALTPSFQQIQSCQLLRTEDKVLSTQSNKDTLVSHVEEIQPMCCVVGTGDTLKKMRETRSDCFTETQVICNLKSFRYESGGTRTVYFRRSSKILFGKRVNMVPVVALREGQHEAPELYVSTTLRFCRAVKQSCVKGNGEQVSCWSDTLKGFQRDSFIVGTDMYQEIQNPALTGFIKRVNPNSWCNYLPGHLESMIEDPIMIEVAELAIKLMDCKIPNAFAVAELLYCPIKKVHKCLKFWKMYLSDLMFRKVVLRKRVGMIEDQMRSDWTKLSKIAHSYVQQKYGSDTREAAVCAELFKRPDVSTKAQKMWQSLIKRDTKSKDKELALLYSSAKVFFLKLRTYQNKLKKVQQAGEGNRGDSLGKSLSLHSTEHQEAHASSECAAAKLDKDEAAAGIGEKDDRLHYIVTPDPIPVSTWLKNLSTLLLSEPWLNGDALRREAVCTLLRLDDTLLDKQHCDILRDWVINNRTIVCMLQRNKLQDRLSTALVHCLETMSTDNWRRKVLLSFQGSKGEKSAHSMRARGSRHRYSGTKNEDLYLSLAKEVSSEEEGGNDDDYQYELIRGEDLGATMDYDNTEPPDEYDCSDSFIDDGSFEEKSSSEPDEDFDVLRTLQVEKRGKEAKSKKPERLYKRLREETRCYRGGLLSDSQSSSEEQGEETIRLHKKPVKHARLDKTKGRLSRSGKEVKKKSQEHSDRQDKTCAKKKQHRYDKRAKPAKYTKGSFSRNASLGKSLESDSKTSEFKEKVETKWVGAPEIKDTRFSTSDTDSDTDHGPEGGLQHKKTQRGTFNNRVGPKLGKTEASPENKAVRAIDTFEQEPLNRKRKRVWDCQEEKLNRERSRRPRQRHRHHRHHRMSDSETYEYKEEAEPKRVGAPEIKGTRFSTTDSDTDTEEGSQRKKTQRGSPEIKGAHFSTADKAVRATDTFQQEPLNRKGKRVWDCQEEKFDRERRHCRRRRRAEHSVNLAREPTSASNSSSYSSSSYSLSSSSSSSDDEENRGRDEDQEKQEEEVEEKEKEEEEKEKEEEGEEEEEDKDLDLDVDFSQRPDSGPENTGCSEPESDSGEKEYIISM